MMMDELESRTVALQSQSGIRFKPDEFDSDISQRSSKRHSTTFETQPQPQQQDNGFPVQRRPTSDYIDTTRTGNEMDSVKKKNWIESLGKAFSRKKTRTNSISEAELEAAEARASFVVDDDVLLPTQLSPGIGNFKRSFTLPTKLNPDHLDPDQRTSSAEDSDCLLSPFVVEKDELVVELQRQLDERDAKMKEIRQEAMCSVSQLQELSAIVMEMKDELDSLKAENDRLQRLVKQDGVAGPVPMSSSPSTIDAGWGWPAVNASAMTTTTSSSNRDSRRADQGNASAAAAAAARASASSSASSAAASAAESSRCGAKFHVIKQHV